MLDFQSVFSSGAKRSYNHLHILISPSRGGEVRHAGTPPPDVGGTKKIQQTAHVGAIRIGAHAPRVMHPSLTGNEATRRSGVNAVGGGGWSHIIRTELWYVRKYRCDLRHRHRNTTRRAP